MRKLLWDAICCQYRRVRPNGIVASAFQGKPPSASGRGVPPPARRPLDRRPMDIHDALPLREGAYSIPCSTADLAQTPLSHVFHPQTAYPSSSRGSAIMRESSCGTLQSPHYYWLLDSPSLLRPGISSARQKPYDPAGREPDSVGPHSPPPPLSSAPPKARLQPCEPNGNQQPPSPLSFSHSTAGPRGMMRRLSHRPNCVTITLASTIIDTFCV